MSCSQFFKCNEAQRLDKAPCINIRIIFGSWLFFLISANHISKERDNNAVWPRLSLLFSIIDQLTMLQMITEYFFLLYQFQVWEHAGCGSIPVHFGRINLLHLLLLSFQEEQEEKAREEKGWGGGGLRRSEKEDSGRDHDVLLPYPIPYLARLHDKTDYYSYFQTNAAPSRMYKDFHAAGYRVSLPD